MEKRIPKPKKDKSGMSYGHWIVKEQDIKASQESGKVYWLCECDCGCGTVKSIRTDALSQVTVGGCDNMTGTFTKECQKCHKKFYPKKQAKTRRYCYECVPEYSTATGNQMRKVIKKWALDYKGNKCEICGYSKCSEALDFHHINPQEKDFNFSDRDVALDWEMIKKELDKCILVCSNCHREIHAGLRNLYGKEIMKNE